MIDQPQGLDDTWPILPEAAVDQSFNLIGPAAHKVTEGVGLVFSDRLRVYGRWRGQGPLEPVILAFLRDKMRCAGDR